MEWSDSGIVLSARPHGETSAIVEALTHQHGRHLGLVRGGHSRRKRPELQPGNTLALVWRARLSDHLGNFAAEPMRLRAGDLLDRKQSLIGLNAFAAVASAALPEREAHPGLFEAGEVLLEAMAKGTIKDWGPLYVRWEAGLLDALGFGLDLSQCAVSGSREDLAYVSPRSGRAVSVQAGAPYRERLLSLPGFLLGSQNGDIPASDVAAGLDLTGTFLAERVLHFHNRQMPASRRRLAELACESE